jgi:hypothetical protein
MIKANAGKMRGVRVMRDPEGILLDPFVDDNGIQYGYVLVYGEEAPAVFDGTQWYPILDDEQNWEDTLPEKLQVQAQKIVEHAPTNVVYAELAAIMNILVGAGAPVSEGATVVDYGATGN